MTTVYLSSTFKDLEAHRAAVAQALRQLPGDLRVIAMEDYVAKDDRPKDRCVADVAGCELYVGILAWRYGFVPPGETQSITELEFRAAERKNRLLFYLAENAPWPPQQMDSQSGENDPARIRELRKVFQLEHSAIPFTTPDDLARKASAAVVQALAEASAPRPAPPLFREIRSSLLVACAPADDALAKGWADLVQGWVDLPITVSPTALFSEGDEGFRALERALSQCEAGLVVLSPRSFPMLADRAERVATVLGIMRARLGAVRLLACGELGAPIPEGWGRADAVAAPPDPPEATSSYEQAVAEVRRWVGEVAPRGAGRAIGLPFCAVAMKSSELASLEALLSAGSTAGAPGVQSKLLREVEALAAAGVAWRDRYGAAREDWQPFGPGEKSLKAMVAAAVAQVNEGHPELLGEVRLKPQWYPFDVLVAESHGEVTGLRGVYREMALAGCVLVVDELSLLHQDLVAALARSPFVNNLQVAIVTVSPDSRRTALADILEKETRDKLVGAFERYVDDCDPQCELAVSDARRLRRWLRASLPETAASLRDPRPNTAAIAGFFRKELGPGAERRRGDDYAWARGGRR